MTCYILVRRFECVCYFFGQEINQWWLCSSLTKILFSQNHCWFSEPFLKSKISTHCDWFLWLVLSQYIYYFRPHINIFWPYIYTTHCFQHFSLCDQCTEEFNWRLNCDWYIVVLSHVLVFKFIPFNIISQTYPCWPLLCLDIACLTFISHWSYFFDLIPISCILYPHFEISLLPIYWLIYSSIHLYCKLYSWWFLAFKAILYHISQALFDYYLIISNLAIHSLFSLYQFTYWYFSHWVNS